MRADGEFFDEFIDDYFSECEEHLATVRRVLLAFEERGGAVGEGNLLQDLLRALHTLKGLSGMVGLSSAEEVAHAMEDGLRAVPDARHIPRSLLDALFSGVALLDTCIAARRAHQESPSPGPYVDQMRDIVRGIGAHGAHSGSTESTALATPVIRVFRFAASRELVERGIGVEVIRKRLATLGDITSTTPIVQDGGGVVFEFSVAVRPDAVPPEEWRDDAVSWDAWDEVIDDAPVGLVVHSGKVSSSAGHVAASASNVVRVDLSRLDDLMRMVGELVVSRGRLGDVVARARGQLTSAVEDDLSDANIAIERQLRAIREGVMRVRLVAVNEVFERLRFAMRDVARETQKSIRLEFEGQDTEIDKLVIDRMLEPLLHLVRNAASHGIESRDDRLDAGKSPEGTVTLRARAAGDRIVLEVEDDGAGIDIARVARRAVSAGLISTYDSLTPDMLLDVLCSSGFSTRDSADMTSGRGVGMAVVRDTIRAIGGTLFVDSTLGRGTRFTIELPLTLMITDALVLEVGDQSMAIPQVSLREIIPIEDGTVTRVENNDVFSYRGRVIPLVDLADRFHLGAGTGKRHALIVGGDGNETGLVVNRVLGLREIVVHPVTDPLVAMPGIAGATELADGRISLVLDAAALVRTSRDRIGRSARPALAPPLDDMTHAIPVKISEHTWS